MKNKNIKAAFFDVDGTLYDHEKRKFLFYIWKC